MTDERDHSDEQAVFEAFEPALPRVAPPEGLFDRILMEIGSVGSEQPVALATRRQPALRRFAYRRLVAGLTFAAAAAAAAVAIAVSHSPAQKPVAQAAIVPHLAGARVSGTAALYGARTAGGTLRLTLRAVPQPAPGDHYEVWVLAKGQTAMTDVGPFTPHSATVKLSLALPAPGDYAAVDVSVQKNGGPKQHSNVSLAGGSFQPVS